MKTLALVIGNNNYYTGYTLNNAVNDATAIKQVFERLGYEVMFKINGNSKDIEDLLTAFEQRIEDYDATIFYFAGHGIEAGGENYLAFTECQIDNTSPHHHNQTCIRLNELLNIYKKKSNKINIAIIDACRKSFERGNTHTHTPIQAPKGTLIAFSTSPNEGASDVGYPNHSIFTGALLQFIGKERLSVEELFKKVRKAVFAFSNGKQTTWENTSLIGDFYFNTGQLVYDITIPYSEDVVKDVNYSKNDTFGQLIQKIKSYDWHTQNPAIEEALQISPSSLDKNQQFIFGRNLLQASGSANNAKYFMQFLPKNLKKYSTEDEENHVLNGILFEIYFNPQAEFRKDKTKKHFFEEIISLRKTPLFKKSFEFIHNLLVDTKYPLIYLPEDTDEIFEILVVANNKSSKDYMGKEIECQIVSKILFNDIDILNEIRHSHLYKINELELMEVLSDFFSIPKELIKIISPIQLNRILVVEELAEESDW